MGEQVYFDELNEHDEDKSLEGKDDEPKELKDADDDLEAHTGADDQHKDLEDGISDAEGLHDSGNYLEGLEDEGLENVVHKVLELDNDWKRLGELESQHNSSPVARQRC